MFWRWRTTGICIRCAITLQRASRRSFVSSYVTGKLPRDPAQACPGPSYDLHWTRRHLASSRNLRDSAQPNDQERIESEEEPLPETEDAEQSPEAVVQHVRHTYGERVPTGLLNEQEIKIYERLYGPVIETSEEGRPNDVDPEATEEFELEQEDQDVDDLVREEADGELEEMIYDEEGDLIERGEEDEEAEDSFEQYEEPSILSQPDPAANSRFFDAEDGWDDGAAATGGSVRSHPLTTAGRFGTWPSTLQLPKESLVRPSSDILANASNKHLSQTAKEALGGQGLPNSPAMVKRPGVKHEPIGLEASQSSMGEMEASAYIAAILPGAYVACTSTLVEVRKRLGSVWLRELMDRPEGPRILDAGAAGAGVLAWREIIRAEWEPQHGEESSRKHHLPYGKSTVVTGSHTLRQRMSRLLDNTTFIPRLPDYVPDRDHPSLEHKNPQPRKQYDIIIAPYTLWQLKEEHERKSQVQNFWSLLDPRGGVLILIEKGVPPGFELIASARETLLKHHILPQQQNEDYNSVEDVSPNRFGPKEHGRIIAPCTNHAKCPLQGVTRGPKLLCRFSQRYIRPPYLQDLLKAKHKNHDDLLYSFVALQRGVDQHTATNEEGGASVGVQSGQKATDLAFEGYEHHDPADTTTDVNEAIALSLPRTILPPIKRKGHVIFDLCTPAGAIERWTVPRSFSKVAYRDARKAGWGDLWALGAKTRVARGVPGVSSSTILADGNAEDANDNTERGPEKMERKEKGKNVKYERKKAERKVREHRDRERKQRTRVREVDVDML